MPRNDRRVARPGSRRALIAALLFSGVIAGCSGVSSPSSYPDDNFTGTIQVGAEVDKAFTVKATGEMQMTLQSLTPAPVVGFLWMGVGQYVGSICSPLPGYYTTQAPINQQFSFSTIPTGSYCMFLSDGNGVLKQPAAFAVNTKHP
jgi:hypothetical protein